MSADTLPTPSEILTAARHSLLLLRARRRLVRDPSTRTILIIGLAVVFVCAFVASRLGSLVMFYAEFDGPNTLGGSIAVDYLLAYQAEQYAALPGFILAGAVLAGMLSAFNGSAITALLSPPDLVSIHPHRLHRYFDSVTVHALTAVSFLQLVAVIAAGSVLAIEHSHTTAMIVAGLVWLWLLVATVAAGWTLEWVARTLPRAVRIGLATVLGGTAMAAFLFTEDHGTTLFGIGPMFAGIIQTSTPGATVAMLAAAIAVTCLAGIGACTTALRHPEVAASDRPSRTRSRTTPGSPARARTRLVFTQILRSPESRRPLILVTVVSITAAWLAPSLPTITTTILIAAPLAVGTGCISNVFAAIGPGMPWLLTQPGTARRLYDSTLLVSVTTMAVIATAVWVPVIAVGHIPEGTAITTIAAQIAIIVAISRSATHKAAFRPVPAGSGRRGDPQVPPATAINYTLRFGLIGGAIGTAVTSQTDTRAASACLAVIAWCLLRHLMTRRLFTADHAYPRLLAVTSSS